MTITRVEIDLNVRVRGNDTYSGFEYVTGSMAVGDTVEVYESESEVSGVGRITEIDVSRQLVFLSVDWASLRAREQLLDRLTTSLDKLKLNVETLNGVTGGVFSGLNAATGVFAVTSKVRDLLQIDLPRPNALRPYGTRRTSMELMKG